MSVEKINDCVLLPHHCDWSEKLQWSRKWDTRITSGVTAAEDRSTGRTAQSFQKMTYRALAVSLQERARLTARVLEGLKTGRVCAPFWGRQNIISGSGLTAPGGQGSPIENASWKWQSSDYAFITVRAPSGVENRSVLLNGGGTTTSGYTNDTIYFDTGASLPTGATIDATGVIQPPPNVIYQTARVSTGAMFASVGGFNPYRECRVHLHFAQIDHAVNLAGNRQKFRVDITGSTSVSILSIEILFSAGVLDKAILLTEAVVPDKNGMVTIQFTPIAGGNNTASISAIEIHQKDYEVIPLSGLTSPSQISFTGYRILGYWPAGSTICPLLFGKLSVDNLQALTTRHANTKLTIQEPLGTGTVATAGTCPAEICIADPVLTGGGNSRPRLPDIGITCSALQGAYSGLFNSLGDVYTSGFPVGLPIGTGNDSPDGETLNFMISKQYDALAAAVPQPNIDSQVYWHLVNLRGAYWQAGAASHGSWYKVPAPADISSGSGFWGVELVYCTH